MSGNAIIGALRAVLGLDSAAFEQGADAAAKKLAGVGKKFAKIGDSMQAVGGTISTYVTLPLMGIGAAAIKGASEAAQALASVEQALKTMGDGAGFGINALKDMADELQGLSTFDGDEILSKVTANLLTFGNVQGDVFKRAQKMALDLSVRLGQDLQTSAIQLGKALNDPVKGITALTRVGVSFTQQQKDQIEAMVKAGNVAGAQAMILAELERQYGGQAEALAKTDPGKMTQAWVAIGDAMESVGAVILPVLADLSVYVKQAAEWFRDLSPETQRWIVIAGGIAAALGPALMAVGMMVSSFGVLLPLLPAIGAGFAAMLGPLGLLAAAVAGVVYAWYNWDEISAQFPAQSAAIETGLNALQIAATGLYQHLQLTFQGVKQLLTGDFAGAWESTKQIVTNLINTLIGVVDTIFPGFSQSVLNTVNQTVQYFVDLKDRAIAAVQAMVTGIEQWIVGKLNAVFASVQEKIKIVSDAFYGLYDAVVGHSYVPDMVLEIGDWMAQLDGRMVAPAVATTQKTATVFEAMGQSIEQSLGSWIDSAIDGTFRFKDALLDLAKAAAKAGLKNILGQLFNGGGGSGGGFLSGLFKGSFGGFYAGGGYMSPNKWHVVGENGPELLPPLGRRNMVVPNHALGGGGGVVSYNIDARGADQSAIRRLEETIRQMASNQGKAAVAAVNRERNWNAGFA